MQEKTAVFDSECMKELDYTVMSEKQRRIADIFREACGMTPERRYFYNYATGENGLQVVLYGILTTTDIRGIIERLSPVDSFYIASYCVDGYPCVVVELH